MAKFADKWNKSPEPGLGEKIGGALRSEGPLRPRLNSGVTVIHRQKNSLNRMVSKLESRDKVLLGKVSAAKERGDIYAAKSLAGELVQLRHVKKVMMMARLALEKVEIRLSMDVDLGDAVSAIAPTVQLMRKLGTTLGRFVPEADTEINQMSEMLGGFMANTVDGSAFNAEPVAGMEVDSIMQEAAAVAGQQVESKFPSMPEAVQGGARSAEGQVADAGRDI